MRLATIQFEESAEAAVLLPGEPRRAALMRHLVPDANGELIDSIWDWENLASQVHAALQQCDDSITFPVSDEMLLAPIAAPEKIYCIGRNYHDHAAEMGSAAGETPVVFSKFSSAIIGPLDEIQLPPISEQVDYEAELVVVIGKSGKNIPIESASDHVFGFCCGNDISARDWQKGKPGGQWLLGKTFDTFAPIGPWIVTNDEVGDVGDLAIRQRLNGELVQDAKIGQLIFSIEYLVSHLSKFSTLQPGDLIFTGTPAGVGAARNPQVFLKPGDQLEVEIDKIGLLRNSVRC